MTRPSSALVVLLLLGIRAPGVAHAQTTVVVDQPPALIQGTCQPAVYPRILQQAGIQGRVTLEFVIGADGVADSSSFRVSFTNHPLFVPPAKAAVMSCRFQPGKVHGQPVATLSNQTVTFSLTPPDSTHPKP